MLMLGNIFRVQSKLPNMIIYLNITSKQAKNQKLYKCFSCWWQCSGTVFSVQGNIQLKNFFVSDEKIARKVEKHQKKKKWCIGCQALPSGFTSESTPNRKFVIRSGWFCKILPNFTYHNCNTITFKSHTCLSCWYLTKLLVINISDWQHYSLN